jgi:hypothetical protein
MRNVKAKQIICTINKICHSYLISFLKLGQQVSKGKTCLQKMILLIIIKLTILSMVLLFHFTLNISLSMLLFTQTL